MLCRIEWQFWCYTIYCVLAVSVAADGDADAPWFLQKCKQARFGVQRPLVSHWCYCTCHFVTLYMT